VNTLGLKEPPVGPAIKICGLTRAEDVRLAAGLGAWAVGFVLAVSPRQVTAEEVRELAKVARAAPRPGALPAPLVVGVFAAASLADILAVARVAELDGVQLHGGPVPEAAAVRAAVEVERGAKGGAVRELLVIQALPVASAGADRAALAGEVAAALRAGADLVVLDTARGGQFGGSGCPFAWEGAAEATQVGPVLVAGGIGPHNVGEALTRSGAWGVDVSSGIERSPGEKDPGLMEQLFEEAAASWLRRQVPGTGWRRWKASV